MRGRIDWKYCLGLEMTDQGFDFSVLSEFRARLLAAGAGQWPLELLLARLKEAGLVAAGMRQRTDSTHVLARIRDLNRLELAWESVRAALEALARAEPGWLAGILDPSWQRAYGQRICDLRLPEGKDARAGSRPSTPATATTCWNRPASRRAPAAARNLPAMRALRLVLVQQFYRQEGRDGEKVTWREDGEHGLPPGRDRIVSPHDLDARYGEKRDTRWLGYKAHYSETASDPARDDPATGMPEHPSLITNTETTRASVPDAVMTQVIHGHLEEAGLPPGEHLTDSGYASAERPGQPHATSGIALIGPLLADTSRQARAGGYTTAMFTIDWDARQATCPQGTPSTALEPCQPGGPRGDRRQVPRPRLPRLPRPGQVHHRDPDRAAAHHAGPARSTKPSPPPAPSRKPHSGKRGTPAAPAWKA